MELIPKVGNHLIIFGDTSQMSQKFENLILFYRKGLTKVGWDKYNIINLKFKNQVVCSKKYQMGTSEIIVGLDIGTTKIAVIVGQKNEFGKVEILGCGKAESIGVKRGVVANIENTTNSIIAALKEASDKSDVEIRAVNVGIAGLHIRSLQHHGSIIRKNSESEISQEDIDMLTEDMYKLAMSPGEEIIDVIPQYYIVDGEPGIKQPKGMEGVSLEANFHIITCQTTAARNIVKCVRKAGLEVEALILEPLASAEAVLSEDEKEAGVVLVDIGGGYYRYRYF